MTNPNDFERILHELLRRAALNPDRELLGGSEGEVLDDILQPVVNPYDLGSEDPAKGSSNYHSHQRRHVGGRRDLE